MMKQWENEPDREEFKHAGFPCLLQRNPMGAWCGYVAVPPEHPHYGNHYDDVEADVHGGLTYADYCQGKVCHKPNPGDPDNVYWFGFDCAHADDLVPQYDEVMRDLMPKAYKHDSTYRDIAFVRRETKSLAQQLARQAQKARAAAERPQA